MADLFQVFEFDQVRGRDTGNFFDDRPHNRQDFAAALFVGLDLLGFFIADLVIAGQDQRNDEGSWIHRLHFMEEP